MVDARCYDDDATAVYCSSGPHVRSQMWLENAKNEACFPLYIIYVCLTGCMHVTHDPYGAIWVAPHIRAVKDEVRFFFISGELSISQCSLGYLAHV